MISQSLHEHYYEGHWPVYDRFLGWLYDFGLLEERFSHGERGKRWRGLWVDRGLKEEWLERMNDISCIEIVFTCAGHKEQDDWYQHSILRFSPICDPRADARGASDEEKRDLLEEVKKWFGDIAVDIQGLTGSDIPLDQVMEDITLVSKSRKEMPSSYFTEWWETVISRLEAFGEEEVARWGPDIKGESLPEELVPPFRAKWYLIEPNLRSYGHQEAGPFDTIDEAIEAAYAGAIQAGGRKVALSHDEAYQTALQAKSGASVELFDASIKVLDAFEREVPLLERNSP